MDIHVAVGDEIIVDSLHVGSPPRRGEIVDVRGEGERIHYVVRWNGGEETIFFPATTAHTIYLRDQHA